MKHVSLMQVHNIKSMLRKGSSQKTVANIMGIHERTVRRIANGETHQRIRAVADRMEAFGLNSSCGNTRYHARHSDTHGSTRVQHNLSPAVLRACDPLDILLAAEAARVDISVITDLPERIEPNHYVEEVPEPHGDTWEEFLEVYAGVIPLALKAQADGSGKLATQGADVNTWAVRDPRYNIGPAWVNSVRMRRNLALADRAVRNLRAKEGKAFVAEQQGGS